MLTASVEREKSRRLFERSELSRLALGSKATALVEKASPPEQRKGAARHAEKRTRTSTGLPPLDPESSASTTSATSAFCRRHDTAAAWGSQGGSNHPGKTVRNRDR